MKTIRQLLRQPMRTAAGVLLVAVAVAVLGICVSHGRSSANTLERMDGSFTSVALLSEACHYERTDGETVRRATLPEGLSQWVEQTAAEHPELVEAVISHGLASAYIPELIPDNYTQYFITASSSVADNNNLSLQAMEYGQQYSCAMLEITLTGIGEPAEQILRYRIGPGEEDWEAVSVGVSVQLTGTLDRVVGLADGYPDPTGFCVRMTLNLPDMAAFQELNPTVGGRYLVYGTDYFDADHDFRQSEAEYLGMDEPLPPFDPECMTFLTQEEIDAVIRVSSNPAFYDVAFYQKGSISVTFKNTHIDQYRSIWLTLEDKSAMPQYVWEEGPFGQVPRLITEQTCVDAEGNEAVISQEEYGTRCAQPTIARLDGTAEEFLFSEAGALWQRTLENLAVNSQSFAVIGVDSMDYVADFALETASIVEGRDFTQEELGSGAKVCLLSKHLAELNGLTVGDTITPRFYNYDLSAPCQTRLSSGKGTVQPLPCLYGPTTPFVDGGEEFTIVGLYEQNVLWQSPLDDLYTFTPNTVFVPKTSVPSTMDYSDQGFFRTVVLKNGAIQDFDALAVAAGYDGKFLYYDQGYSDIAQSLYDYDAVSRQSMAVGLTLYVLLMALFLLLFLPRHGKTLNTMDSLGAARKQKYAHVVISSLGILIPGTAVGAIGGILLQRRAAEALMDSANIILPVEPDPGTLLAVSAVQLAIALCAVLLLAVPMTQTRSLMKKK